jgi:predicted acyl esterase
VPGPIEVHLWVATSAVDTDFTVKLIDVYPTSAWYPQGYARNLTEHRAAALPEGLRSGGSLRSR